MGWWDRWRPAPRDGQQQLVVVAAAGDASPEPQPGPKPAEHHPSWRSVVRGVNASTRARGLTPARLAAYLNDAVDGDPTAQAELLTEIEDRDTHLVGVLNTRKEAVAGLPWTVVPGGPRATDRRIAGYVREVLQGIGDFEAALFDLLDSISKGYAGTEIDWRAEGRDVWVEALLHRPPNWFQPSLERQDQWVILSDEQPAGEPLRPGAWIWHEARAKSGLTAPGRGLGRPLAWMFLFKSYSLKDWLVFLETCGMPVRIGKYQQGTSEADLKVLFSALKSLGSDAAAMIPSTASIEFLAATRGTTGSDVYERLVQWATDQQSIVVLGQTLTTQAGDKGSQALGRVHNDVRMDLRRADARKLASTLSADLVRWIVDFKFGPQADYPRFSFEVDTTEQRLERVKLFQEVQKLGVPLPAAHVHEVLGVPLPADGEAVYEPRAPTPAQGGSLTMTAGQRPVCACCGEHHVAGAQSAGPPELSAEVERVLREAMEGGGAAAWQKVCDELRAYLLQAQGVEELSQRLNQAVEQLDLQELTDELAAELLTAELVGRIQVRRGDLPVGEWPAVAPTREAAWWRTRVAMTRPQWDKLTEAARSRAFTLARFTSLTAIERVQEKVGDALSLGWSIATLEDELGDTYQLSPSYLDNILRTNLGAAYNVGRYQEQVVLTEERPYWLYEAILDERTRVAHARMHGKVYRSDHPIWLTWYPPNGFACRCMVRALTAAEVAELGLVVTEELPTQKQAQWDGRITVEPLLPEDGFRRNPALEPHQFDFDRFPVSWRRALGVL